MNWSRFILATTAATAFLQAFDASAQDTANVGLSAAADTSGTATADANAATTTPPPPAAAADEPVAAAAAPPAAPPPAMATGESDHDAMVGHLGVGYLGMAYVPYGSIPVGTNDYPADQQAPAPVIGVRYWLDPRMGIDAGLGFSTTFGSNSTTPPGGGGSTSVDAQAPTAIVLHGGLPLALMSARHYAFEIIPELNIGYASADQGTQSVSGLHVDLGARAGAEIQFGFMGIPQLALQGSVGLRLNINRTKTEPDGGANVTSSRTVIATTVYDNPWNIFAGNVAALYYF